jgi:CheY-like chemotaxis protein
MTNRRADLSEEYLSQITHEFRGSLNANLGCAEYLRSGRCEDAARVRAAETIIRHAREQSAMIGELMDTWRLASGTLSFAVNTSSLGQIVHSAMDGVQPLARARSVQMELHDATPDGGGRVRGDSRRLAQALATLLSNAVHFAPENSVVAIGIDPGAGAGRVTIHDDGQAVPASALPYLFDRTPPAEQARSSPRASFRLGLGLARDVITRHGGSIEAESAGGDGGMTFRVTLPTGVHPGSLASANESADGARDPLAPSALRGLRVLLVDDEPDAREALTGILRVHGADVEAAASAAEAIDALQRQRFDVLLADIGMPGADGYDLIRYVRGLEANSSAHVPAVAVTAFSSDLDRRRALDAGFQVHLSKPVDPAALIATVAVLGRPTASVR